MLIVHFLRVADLIAKFVKVKYIEISYNLSNSIRLHSRIQNTIKDLLTKMVVSFSCKTKKCSQNAAMPFVLSFTFRLLMKYLTHVS